VERYTKSPLTFDLPQMEMIRYSEWNGFGRRASAGSGCQWYRENPTVTGFMTHLSQLIPHFIGLGQILGISRK